MALWNLRSGALKPLGSLPPPKNGHNVAAMDKFMASELTGAIINEKQDKNQACNLGFLINVIFATFKEDPHATIHADDLMVTPSTLKEHSSSLLVGTAASEPHKPVPLYDSQKKRWNWVFLAGNLTSGGGLSNEAHIALFLNTIATTVGNSTKTDHTALSPCQQHIWMVDWSSQCMAGLTGYNQKPDLVLVSNMITSHNKITWLSLKVIREYSKESFQPASHIGRTMDTKVYLVMVDQPWRHFVLGLSLANEELWVHFYDHSGGLISLPFNIHAELDSFLYIISRLVFGICLCIGFDMTIKISPPPINSHRQVTGKSPPTESGPSATGHPLWVLTSPQPQSPPHFLTRNCHCLQMPPPSLNRSCHVQTAPHLCHCANCSNILGIRPHYLCLDQLHLCLNPSCCCLLNQHHPLKLYRWGK